VEARPRPVVWLCHQSAGHGIEVHVLELLNEFALGVDVEIVVTRLPERSILSLHGNRQLESLKRFRQSNFLWLTDEQMDVHWHYNVSAHEELIADAHDFERVFEEVSCDCGSKIGSAAITTEGDEMEVARLLVSDEPFCHAIIVSHISKARWCWPHGRTNRKEPTSQTRDMGHPHLFGGSRYGPPAYLQSILLSWAAAICHLPSRFNQVSVQTWHCFASGCVLSLPVACSLP
jgi:hypothetical protein